MKKFNKGIRSCLKVSIPLMAAGLASIANAGEIVTSWTYSTDATFSDATFTSPGGSEAPYELTWGNPAGDFLNPTPNFVANQSGLTVGTVETQPGPGTVPGPRTGGGPATGTVLTSLDGLPNIPGEVGPGSSFTHFNNPISTTFPLLTGAIITDTLTLTAVDGDFPGGTVDAPDIVFPFNFLETPNGAACAAGTPNPCGDLLGFAPVQSLDVDFIYDDVEYLANVLAFLGDDLNNPQPIPFLAPAECVQLGFANGLCQGFLTAEDANTTINFAFFISVVPFGVPIPSTLLLIGLGLLGLGYRYRTAA